MTKTKIKKKIKNWLKEEKQTWEEIAKEVEEDGYTDSALNLMLNMLDLFDFSLQEHKEDCDVWITASVAINKGGYYTITYNNNVYLEIDDIDTFIDFMIQLQEKAEKTIKRFN
jgi:acyl carrier protein